MNFIIIEILNKLKLFLSYFLNFRKLIIFLFLITPVFFTLIYYLIFVTITIFFYFFLFLKNVIINKKKLIFKQSNYNLNILFIFLKTVYWEGLFIYAYYYFYNFLYSIFIIKNLEKDFFSFFFKILVFFVNFITLKLFKYVLNIPYKTISITLDLTERFYSLLYEWKFNNKVFVSYLFVNISESYFIFLKEDILKKKIFYNKNKIDFNPSNLNKFEGISSINNINIISNVIKYGDNFNKDTKNNLYIMAKHHTETRDVTHLGLASKMKNGKMFNIFETTKDYLRVTSEQNYWTNLKTIKVGKGSLKENLDVYTTPVITSNISEEHYEPISSEKYANISLGKIMRSNFHYSLLKSLDESNKNHLESVNNKIILSKDYKNFNQFVNKNFDDLNDSSKFYIDALSEFESKFGVFFNNLTENEQLELFISFVNLKFDQSTIIDFLKNFDENN